MSRLAFFAALLGAALARADGAPTILEPPAPYAIQSTAMRFSVFDQWGHGYQSQAGPKGGPGSEQATIWQPQVEVVATQGARLTHRITVPLDIISAASPDALDAVSNASRENEAGSLDLDSTYQVDPNTSVSLSAGTHLEEVFRSWNVGVGAARVLADGNAVLSASLNQVVDWFDAFNVHGLRLGRVSRSSSNANLALSQLLSPTTIAAVNYGVTIQTGALGNTWNSVPLANGYIGSEVLPTLRHRHALVARLAQALPWAGAVQLFYRFYVDNWGLTAHTGRIQLYQHVTPYAYLRLDYRLYWQSGVDFFTTSAPASGTALRTADSDLAPFTAQTLGALVAVNLPLRRHLRELHADVGYERYFRTNDLQANIYTCSLGFRF